MAYVVTLHSSTGWWNDEEFTFSTKKEAVDFFESELDAVDREHEDGEMAWYANVNLITVIGDDGDVVRSINL